jgi:hypothetical protein
MARAAIGDDRNDNVCFAGVAENLRNALSREAIVARKHHDVGCGCDTGPSLVGAAEAQIGRVVEDVDAGIAAAKASICSKCDLRSRR